MKTILITGTDWEGPQPYWHNQPFLDGGRLKHHRNNLEDWKNVLFEAGNLGRATALAIGIRGTYTDWRDLEWASLALDAYRDYRFNDVGGPWQYLPALLPWYDTVGLPDYVNPPNYPKDGTQTRFDFANDEHIQIGVHQYARVFFDIFWTEARQRGGLNPPNLLRSSNGRLLTAWHGISNDLGYGFTNQHRCQRLLDAVDVWLSNLGLGPADHVVDAEWKVFAPDLRVYALNKWFTLQGAHPSYEIVTHGHVTTAVVIPSFHEGGRNVPSNGGETLHLGLQRAREAKADIVLIEGLTDFVEGAELMRLADGSQRNLDVLREHMALTEEQTKPPQQESIMLVVYEALSRTDAIAHPTRPGYFTSPHPDGVNGEVLAIAPGPSIEKRPMGSDGGYETWYDDGQKAVWKYEHEGRKYTYAVLLVD